MICEPIRLGEGTDYPLNGLLTLPDDRNGVFLLGHSMGAMLAPRIDAEGADVRGLILLAGTPCTTTS